MAEQPTHQPARVVAGHCPDCGNVCVVFNNHEVWPLTSCSCGWRGSPLDLMNRVRLEHGYGVEVDGITIFGTGAPS